MQALNLRQHAFNVFKQLKRQTTNDSSDINSKYLRILLKALLVCLMKKIVLLDNKKNNKEFTIDSSNSNNIKTKNSKKFEKLNFDMKAIYRNLESFIFVIY